jgi:hypothetical protein
LSDASRRKVFPYLAKEALLQGSNITVRISSNRDGLGLSEFDDPSQFCLPAGRSSAPTRTARTACRREPAAGQTREDGDGIARLDVRDHRRSVRDEAVS